MQFPCTSACCLPNKWWHTVWYIHYRYKLVIKMFYKFYETCIGTRNIWEKCIYMVVHGPFTVKRNTLLEQSPNCSKKHLSEQKKLALWKLSKSIFTYRCQYLCIQWSAMIRPDSSACVYFIFGQCLIMCTTENSLSYHQIYFE